MGASERMHDHGKMENGVLQWLVYYDAIVVILRGWVTVVMMLMF